MRQLWWPALLLLLVSVAFLGRAVYVHRRSNLQLSDALLAGIALNCGLAFLIVPQFFDLPTAVRWITLAASLLAIAYSFRFSRRAISRAR